MRKSFIQLTAVGLVAILVLDTGRAAAVVPAEASAATNSNTRCAWINQQTIPARLRQFFWQRKLDPHLQSAQQTRMLTETLRTSYQKASSFLSDFLPRRTHWLWGFGSGLTLASVLFYLDFSDRNFGMEGIAMTGFKYAIVNVLLKQDVPHFLIYLVNGFAIPILLPIAAGYLWKTSSVTRTFFNGIVFSAASALLLYATLPLIANVIGLFFGHAPGNATALALAEWMRGFEAVDQPATRWQFAATGVVTGVLLWASHVLSTLWAGRAYPLVQFYPPRYSGGAAGKKRKDIASDPPKQSAPIAALPALPAKTAPPEAEVSPEVSESPGVFETSILEHHANARTAMDRKDLNEAERELEKAWSILQDARRARRQGRQRVISTWVARWSNQLAALRIDLNHRMDQRARQFRTGHEAYDAGDYDAAVRRLREAAGHPDQEVNLQAAEAALQEAWDSGLEALNQGRLEEAIAHLGRVGAGGAEHIARARTLMAEREETHKRLALEKQAADFKAARKVFSEQMERSHRALLEQSARDLHAALPMLSVELCKDLADLFVGGHRHRNILGILKDEIRPENSGIAPDPWTLSAETREAIAKLFRDTSLPDNELIPGVMALIILDAVRQRLPGVDFQSDPLSVPLIDWLYRKGGIALMPLEEAKNTFTMTSVDDVLLQVVLPTGFGSLSADLSQRLLSPFRGSRPLSLLFDLIDLFQKNDDAPPAYVYFHMTALLESPKSDDDVLAETEALLTDAGPVDRGWDLYRNRNWSEVERVLVESRGARGRALRLLAQTRMRVTGRQGADRLQPALEGFSQWLHLVWPDDPPGPATDGLVVWLGQLTRFVADRRDALRDFSGQDALQAEEVIAWVHFVNEITAADAFPEQARTLRQVGRYLAGDIGKLALGIGTIGGLAASHVFDSPWPLLSGLLVDIAWAALWLGPAVAAVGTVIINYYPSPHPSVVSEIELMKLEQIKKDIEQRMHDFYFKPPYRLRLNPRPERLGPLGEPRFKISLNVQLRHDAIQTDPGLLTEDALKNRKDDDLKIGSIQSVLANDALNRDPLWVIYMIFQNPTKFSMLSNRGRHFLSHWNQAAIHSLESIARPLSLDMGVVGLNYLIAPEVMGRELAARPSLLQIFRKMYGRPHKSYSEEVRRLHLWPHAEITAPFWVKRFPLVALILNGIAYGAVFQSSVFEPHVVQLGGFGALFFPMAFAGLLLKGKPTTFRGIPRWIGSAA